MPSCAEKSVLKRIFPTASYPYSTDRASLCPGVSAVPDLARKEHQLTQQEMADKCGMHITQVRRYEAEQAQPSIEILKK